MAVEKRENGNIVITHDVENGTRAMLKLKIYNAEIPSLAGAEFEVMTITSGSTMIVVHTDDLMRLRHFFTVAASNIERVLNGEG